jgi:parallel beta-helix repeat protein
MSILFILPAQNQTGRYISLDSGGDVDTEPVTVDNSPALRTGNGQVISAIDGNSTPDFFMQFNVDDAALFEGNPTPSIQLDVIYFDDGNDSFTVEYDGISGGQYDNGTFLVSRPVYKTNTQTFKTATFILKDIYFGNRDNGADFRISDQNDGPETIRKITITLLPVPQVINVDSCGANPFDDTPDSTAIQTCIGKAEPGDIVTFTSGENNYGYKGYLVDKTIFLEVIDVQKYLTFTSTVPVNPALLKAAPYLKGFVVKLYSRATLEVSASEIEFLTISHLHLDGNREARVCMGPDGIDDGVGDNWGSWIPNECTSGGDPWCSPGTLDLSGDGVSNIVTDDLHITNTECATAFGMNGGHSMVIMNTIIETAGDHVHGSGCETTDDDSDKVGDWSDGITFAGSGNLVMNNTIVNASDVGIVFFGGQETVIRNNTVQNTTGNHGAFAGIAIHPWITGDVAYGQVVGNIVSSEGDQTCGGIHAGINIGPHMWGGACTSGYTSAVGNATCSQEPAAPQGRACNGACQVWAYLPPGTTYLFTDNHVTGANINYLVEGLDMQGTLIEKDNISTTPRRTDWDAARYGCEGIYWGPTDKIAHHPSLPGWTDMRIHCER